MERMIMFIFYINDAWLTEWRQWLFCSLMLKYQANMGLLVKYIQCVPFLRTSSIIPSLSLTQEYVQIDNYRQL